MTSDGDDRILLASIQLPAEMSSWDDLMSFIKSQVDLTLGDSEKTYGVLLSAEELLSNIIRDSSLESNTASEARVVGVSSWRAHNGDDDCFELEISDNGPPFDPHFDDISDQIPSTPVEQRSLGGLGLYLVKTSVDQVSYSYIDGHNVYALITRLS